DQRIDIHQQRRRRRRRVSGDRRGGDEKAPRMKKILAISDTHLQEDSAVPGPLIDLAKGADLLLHAGDFVSLGAYEAFRDLAPFEAVSGNSDDPAVAALLPQRRVVEVEDVR